MGPVCKYNICKGISTVLTAGTPIITLLSCSDFFVHRSDTAISAAGMFAIFLSVLLFKDKIAENFKVPSAFVISVVSLVLLLMVESLIQPLKYICIATAITSGVDELTFKRFYKIVESKFPQGCEVNKLFGFMLTTSKKLGV